MITELAMNCPKCQRQLIGDAQHQYCPDTEFCGYSSRFQQPTTNPTPETDADTFTPSNGAMIICANGTGDYVKKEVAHKLEHERDEANKQLAKVIGELGGTKMERDQLIKVVDDAVACASQLGWTSAEDIKWIRRAEKVIAEHSLLSHVIAKKGNKQ